MLPTPPPAPPRPCPPQFGSGKSTLLAALIMLLAEVRAHVLPRGAGGGLRVLVAAHTNVAVDRVLQSLQVRSLWWPLSAVGCCCCCCCCC